MPLIREPTLFADISWLVSWSATADKVIDLVGLLGSLLDLPRCFIILAKWLVGTTPWGTTWWQVLGYVVVDDCCYLLHYLIAGKAFSLTHIPLVVILVRKACKGSLSVALGDSCCIHQELRLILMLGTR